MRSRRCAATWGRWSEVVKARRENAMVDSSYQTCHDDDYVIMNGFSMNTTKRDRILWALTCLFASFAVLKATPVLDSVRVLIPIISILVPTTFALIHGQRRLGARTMLVFFVITFAISWTMESSSIATGFPFGHYHYTDNLGPKLGTVPLLIMPAYFSMCYLSWNLAHVLLDKFNQDADRLQILAVPVLAAFIMVMWDLCMDPSRATVKQAWIWHDGGSYFGVPFVNFMGWYLTVYLIFQIFALVQSKYSTTSSHHPVDDLRAGWMLNVGFYFATFLEFVAVAAFGSDHPVTDPAGVVWSTGSMYESLGLVSIFTMGFVSVLAYFKIHHSTALQ
jgi:putative membrane protein